MIFKYLVAVVLVVWFYDRTIKRKTKRMERLFFTENTGQVERKSQSSLEMIWWQKGKVICIIGASVFLVWGVISIIIGCKSNAKVLDIKENGVNVSATIIERERAKNMIGVKSEVLQYDYVLEFVVDGIVVHGKTRASELILEGKEIEIYYIPEAVKNTTSIVEVAIAGADYKPGRNTIWHGVVELFVGVCFILIIKEKF